MKISIIVPVYNVEKYLEACVDSLYQQELDESEYEVILVNDGSSDGSRDIALRLQSQHSNLKLIDQENQGLSGARNTGINNAQGDYIWFVDSDDKIDNCLAKIVEEIEKYEKLDIYGIVLDEVDGKNKHIKYQCDQPTLLHNEVMLGSHAIIGGYNPSSACALIMRRDFLNENCLRFKIGITHEDVEFTYWAMAVAKTVLFSENIVYFYYRWGNTMSTAKDTERLLKYIIDDVEVSQSYTKLAEQVSNKELRTTIINRRNSILLGLTLSLLRNKKKWNPLGINSAVIEKMKVYGFYPLTYKQTSLKKRILSFLLNMEWLLK